VATSSLWPDSLLEQLRARSEGRRVTVGLSGGVDSVVLLHLAHALQPALARLQALHVNHHLQPAADEFQHLCENLCASLNIPLEVVHLDGQALRSDRPEGLETRARKARYEAFEQTLEEDELLLLAHHRDDQLETQLLQLIRGGSVQALAGIPQCRPLGKGMIVRPFLEYPKDRLIEWAGELGLSWIDDPTNGFSDADRNFLRNQILPSLRERWPRLEAGMAATARACQEQTALAESAATKILGRCQLEADALDLTVLREATLPEQKNALRYWLMRDRWPLPSDKALEVGLRDLTNSDEDRSPVLMLDATGEASLRRFRGRLHRVRLQKADTVVSTTAHLETGGDNLHMCGWSMSLTGEGVADEQALEVRLRQGGETLREAPGAPTKLLKKWLQEQAVPPWQRDRLPLLFRGSDLVAIAGLWIDPTYRAALARIGLGLEITRLTD